MGKIVTLINTTADGFCDSQYVIADAEFHEFVHTLLANAHTVGFGRNTFELFQMIWPAVLADPNSPESQVKMARALNDIHKTAFSSTLQQTTWPNSHITSNIDFQKIKDMKASSEQNLLTIGSPGLVAELTRLDLIDEYYFSVQPIIAGKGESRLFAQGALHEKQPLQFIDSRQLRSGVSIQHYRKI
ncbi:MAG: dihydrofolate reductase family protein [Bacteroidetes bacterium]|nr:dihydrofolate reductase family protein [Bacteroidota bacterium]